MSSSPLDPKFDLDSRMAVTQSLAPDEEATELLRILDQHLENLKAGRAVPRAELIERYPHLATQLDACLAGLEFIHGTDVSERDHQRLGDFRIIREVGRGGMGAVYEAEQVSLRRIVALKIMRFGNLADAEAIERFKREAETVAAFHHTNIVPIFAVGVDRGVNYYAMQFIEGQSLAQVLSEDSWTHDSLQVAEWGLQACEALGHAHRRGVVHRDVKPSNLLVDRENRLWLTDFGLARKLDNVTLSVAGALVGTPRYMSPEQAAASMKPVDHRSDIFSLGATLYELLTGAPAFAGETPLEVIQSILTTDPAPVRILAPTTPRDLETIVMMCLAKEPQQRYGSAAELCSDLRAFLDCRPIRARRAGLVERSARWLRRQRHSVRLAATVAFVTLAVTVAIIAGWFAVEAAHQGELQLATASAPLVVDILKDGQLIRTETAPMQNPLHLPAGDYLVRASAHGVLSESYSVSLGAGKDLNYTLDPHDQLLWTSRSVDGRFAVFPSDGSAELVTFEDTGLRLWKRFPTQTITTPLGANHIPDPAQSPGFAWPWKSALGDQSGYGHYERTPWVARQRVDVNKDGTADLILAGRHQAWLAAISGENGRVLWFAPRGRDVYNAGTKRDTLPGLPVISAVLHEIDLSHDIDGDGVNDIIATMGEVANDMDPNLEHPTVSYWLEGIASSTGQTQWRYDIPTDCFALAAGEEVPYELKWFVGRESGAFGGNMGSGSFGRHRIRFGGWKFERRGPHGYRPASVTSITTAGVERLAVVAGKSLILIDPMSGQAQNAPIALNLRPGQPCQWADMDGDGGPDLILLEESIGSKPEATVRLAAWSATKKELLWSNELDASFPHMPGWSIDAPRWPVVGDIDGDGRCEVIIPDGRSSETAVGSGYHIPWGSLSVIDGATGSPRWRKRLVTMDRQIDHVLIGPDINKDGRRELYTATLVGNEFRIHVGALSGETGETLWSNSFTPPQSTNTSVDYHLSPPKWWHAGSDGFPQLIVQIVAGGEGPENSHAVLFSAADGLVTRVGSNVTSMTPADMDGDSVEDLLVFNANSARHLDLGGRLHCIRGIAAEPWSQLGDRGDPVADLDGDGVRDLVSGWPANELVASSGRTGKLLWRTTIEKDGRKYEVRPSTDPATCDLDGDGIGDLLGWTHVSHYSKVGYPFFALSGRTGKRLWTANDITAQILQRVLTAEAHDIDGDGQPEVIWIASLDHGFPLRNSISTNDARLWMFVCSGRSGKLRWASPLSPAEDGPAAAALLQVAFDNAPLVPTIADINGDGIQDFLVPNISQDVGQLETMARSGVDGSVLWSRPFAIASHRQSSLAEWIPPAVCDINGDGLVEVIALESQNADSGGSSGSGRQVVLALEGKTGFEVWKAVGEPASASWNLPHGGSGKVRPFVLRAAENTCLIATLTPGTQPSISVYDSKGVIAQWKLNASLSFSEIWVCDVDHDGIDELVCLSERRLCVLNVGEAIRPRWSLELPAMGPCRILDIRSMPDDVSATIAVAFDASDNRVVGFNATNGTQVWSTAGIISRSPDGTLNVPRRIDWLDAITSQTANAAPYIYCKYGDVSRVRRGTTKATEADVEQLSEWPAPALASAPRTVAGSRPDDRWHRDLPWARGTLPISLGELSWNVTCLLILSVFLVVLPIYFIYRVVRRRQFGMNTLLGLPLIAGLFIVALLVDIPIADDLSAWTERMSVAFAFTPPVLALFATACWITGKRWRRTVGWLLGTLGVSAIAAAVMLWIDWTQNTPHLPEEVYSLRDWPFIWLVGAYATTWLIMLAIPLERAIVWLRTRQRFKYREPNSNHSPNAVESSVQP